LRMPVEVVSGSPGSSFATYRPVPPFGVVAESAVQSRGLEARWSVTVPTGYPGCPISPVQRASPPLGRPMPIRLHLDGEKFDSETIRVMGLAFEMALVALRLADRHDLANEVLARKIMDLAKAGERDPERLCEGVLHESRAPPPQV
jgi:hypothetical protein